MIRFTIILLLICFPIAADENSNKIKKLEEILQRLQEQLGTLVEKQQQEIETLKNEKENLEKTLIERNEYIISLKEITYDVIILIDCWNGKYFDFTHEKWGKLSHKKQVEYATKYQEWYAIKHNLDVTKTVEKAGIHFVFKLIPPGRYWRGSPQNEKYRYERETRSQVLISKPFYVGETEVTQEQWKAVMGDNPSHFQENLQNPVEMVSWEMCEEFCQKSGFSMLTEAEWEYACRAGTTTEFNLGNDISTDKVNYYGNFPYRDKEGRFRNQTVPVKSLPNENSWGCYDFHGNIWEWCTDWFDAKGYTNEQTDPQGPKSGLRRILRGGSWAGKANYCRSAYRDSKFPSDKDSSGNSNKTHYIGFRCALK